MSRENMEIGRRAFEASLRWPRPDFATVNALFDSDHELVSFQSRVEGGSQRGAQGFREYLDSFSDAWESWEVSVEQVTSIDDERVLIGFVARVVGRRSGVPVEQRLAAVATVRDGKVTRSEAYASREQALEAVGLRE